jgi:hypothetical protein
MAKIERSPEASMWKTLTKRASDYINADLTRNTPICTKKKPKYTKMLSRKRWRKLLLNRSTMKTFSEESIIWLYWRILSNPSDHWIATCYTWIIYVQMDLPTSSNSRSLNKLTKVRRSSNYWLPAKKRYKIQVLQLLSDKHTVFSFRYLNVKPRKIVKHLPFLVQSIRSKSFSIFKVTTNQNKPWKELEFQIPRQVLTRFFSKPNTCLSKQWSMNSWLKREHNSLISFHTLFSVVKEIQRINQRELGTSEGWSDTGSWHAQYKDTAWIFVANLDYELTEGDVVCIFSQ